MGNRWYWRPFCTQRYQLIQNVKVALDATGVVGTITGLGVTSVVKTSTGLYTFTFDDSFNDLLGFFASLVAPGTDTVALLPIAKNNYSLTNKTAAVVLQASGGNTVTDVTHACELHVQMTWKNTSVPR